MRACQQISVIVYMDKVIGLRTDKSLHNPLKEERACVCESEIVIDPQSQKW